VTDRELLQQVLDTLKADKDHASYESGVLSTCAAIEERLANLLYEAHSESIEKFLGNVNKAAEEYYKESTND
jgi:hypothetical protein